MAFERLERPVLPVVSIRQVAEAIAKATPMPRMNAEITGLTWPAGTPCACLRHRADGSECGHQWKTRMAGKPNACPKCKQSRWDVAPKQAKRRGKKE